MKKLLTLASVFVFRFSISYAQLWCAAGAGMTADAGGGVYTMAAYNGALYAAGWFYEAGGSPATNIASWNGANWSTPGTGLSGGYSNVLALQVYNGNLYAGGAFYAAGDSATNDIALWDGTNWHTVGTGMSTCTSSVTWVDAFAVYKGKLYAGGLFCTAGGIKANNIACWDGTKWDSVGHGINANVSALCVYNGKLYAGGQFSKAGDTTASSIAVWNDTAWLPVGKGIKDSAVLAMAVYKGQLYVGGNFDSAGGIFAKNIAKWNGTSWTQVSAKGITGTSGVVALCTYDTCLFAGGNFNKAGGLAVKSIALWNGLAWDTLHGGGINHLVNALVVYDTVLYAGGLFTIAGEVPASDIAEWGNVAAGIDEVSDNNEVKVFPNPSNGVFALEVNSDEGLVNSVVEVYNMLGEKIYSSEFLIPNGGALMSSNGNNNFANNSQFLIDLSGHAPGVYLYRIVTETGSLVSSGKLIKE